MVLEMENINLYELSLEVKRKGGTALDLNTDCVVCEFDESPFQLDQKNNIIGYYHDEANLVPKYKLEEGEQRVKHAKLQKFIRTDKHEHKDYYWNRMEDPGNNGFDSLVKSLLETGQSFNIEGAAGTGKSFLIKTLIKQLETFYI